MCDVAAGIGHKVLEPRRCARAKDSVTEERGRAGRYRAVSSAHPRATCRDARRLRSTPFPSSYAKAQARAHIAALAQRGAPDVTLLVEHGRSGITLPMQTVRSQVLNVEGLPPLPSLRHPTRSHSVTGIRGCDDKPDRCADRRSGRWRDALDHSERQRAEAEVLGDLLRLERERRRKGSQPSTEPTVVRKPLQDAGCGVGAGRR